MAAPAEKTSTDKDLSYRRLVEQVVEGSIPAWKEFCERFSKLLFSLLWRYANGDQDQCADLYLYVIEGLHQANENGETFFRLRRYLESLDQFEGKGRLTTWLGRVTQNLVSDYFREQDGRKTLPRNIQRLDLTSQKIFKLLYWDCLSEHEAFATIGPVAGSLSRERFDRLVDNINRNLKNCNRWSLYSEVIRRTPALPLHPVPEDGETPAVQAADPNPASQPAQAALDGEERETAKSMGRKLRELLAALPDESRLLLLCRFRQGMTAAEISRLLRWSDDKKVYGEIERLKNQLKANLQQAGFQWENVAGGLDAIDGMLDEIEPRGRRQVRA